MLFIPILIEVFIKDLPLMKTETPKIGNACSINEAFSEVEISNKVLTEVLNKGLINGTAHRRTAAASAVVCSARPAARLGTARLLLRGAVPHRAAADRGCCSVSAAADPRITLWPTLDLECDRLHVICSLK